MKRQVSLITVALIATTVLPALALAGSQEGTVEIIDPVGGEAWSGIHLVKWADQYTNPDRPVHWDLAYSLDLGASWTAVPGAAGDYRTTTERVVHSWPFDTTEFEDTTTAMFRVTLTITGSGTSTNLVAITNDALAWDNTDPASAAVVEGTTGNAPWFVSDAKVVLSATDATSGVDTISYRVDGGDFATYTEPVVVTEGDHLVEYFATDRAGNSDPVDTLRVRVDTTAPTTPFELQGTLGDEGWWTTNVNVAFAPVDATSGVASTFARADGAPFAEVDNGLLVTGDGDHNVDWYSVDVAGNAEEALTTGFRIDATAPATTFTVHLPKATDDRGRQYLASATDVTLHATDATSGVRDTFYRLDGGDFVLYEAPIHVGGDDGAHVLEFFTVDRAGNAEAVNRVEFWLDNTAPTVDITRPLPGSVSAGGSYFEAGETIRFIEAQVPVELPDAPALPVPENPVPEPTVDADREDVTPVVGKVRVEVATSDGDGAGVERVEYYVDGGLRFVSDLDAEFTWDWDTTVDRLGEHVVTARAVDALGFWSEAHVVVNVLPVGQTGAESTAHQGVSLPSWLTALLPMLEQVEGLNALLAFVEGVLGGLPVPALPAVPA